MFKWGPISAPWKQLENLDGSSCVELLWLPHDSCRAVGRDHPAGVRTSVSGAYIHTTTYQLCTYVYYSYMHIYILHLDLRSSCDALHCQLTRRRKKTSAYTHGMHVLPESPATTCALKNLCADTVFAACHICIPQSPSHNPGPGWSARYNMPSRPATRAFRPCTRLAASSIDRHPLVVARVSVAQGHVRAL